MIAIPAVDLRDGQAVQLVGGAPETERVRLPDPVAVAQHWVATGFGALHVVDLDAALGHGDNRTIVDRIVTVAGVPCQVGGGLREEAAIDALGGVTRLIVGTRAVEDRDWLERVAAANPGRLVVAADVRDRRIVTRGWTRDTRLDAVTFLRSLDALPLAGVLVTDVGREGRLEGVDASLFAGLVRATRHPLQAAGGISTMDDLRRLRDAGVAAGILGMALYTGSIPADQVAREFGT